MKSEQKFSKESDLCAAFIAALPKDWRAYPETCGWDILAVHDSGAQIGIEAKLRLNTHVVAQTLGDGGWHRPSGSPDFRAVLVPAGNEDLAKICRYIGITIVEFRGSEYSPFRPSLPTFTPHSSWSGETGDGWFDWCPVKRCEVPDYVPDVVAGASGPTMLTPWKVKAIKLQILIERRGHVGRSCFKALQLSESRWMPAQGNWLSRTETRGLFRAGPKMPDFRQQHPTNFAEIEADFERWAPPDPVALPGLFGAAA